MIQHRTLLDCLRTSRLPRTTVCDFFDKPHPSKSWLASFLLFVSSVVGCGIEASWHNDFDTRTKDVLPSFAITAAIAALNIIVNMLIAVTNLCLPQDRQIDYSYLKHSKLVTATRVDLWLPYAAQFPITAFWITENGYYPELATVVGLAALLAVFVGAPVAVDKCCYGGELGTATFFFAKTPASELDTSLIGTVERSDEEAAGSDVRATQEAPAPRVMSSIIAKV